MGTQQKQEAQAENNNKEHTLWGSFGSPSSFPALIRAIVYPSATASYTITRLNARIPAHHAVIPRFWPNIPSNSASHAEEVVPVISFPTAQTAATYAHHA
jgi:hypothetical protein